MKKVSVITIVYNNEQFIDQCINSIIKQTYQNLEIILVDDGSTDGSLSIMQKYAQQDSRIRIIYEKNHGIGYARNTGIHAATGDYVLFVDADDYIGSDHVHALLTALQNDNSDIAVSSFYRLNSAGQYIFFLNDDYPEQKAFVGPHSAQDWLEHESFFNSRIGFNFNTCWAKLFKRELFKYVEFNPDLTAYEDCFTVWKLYLAANTISYVNIDDYCYRFNDQSITKSKAAPWQIVAKSFEERIAVMNILGFDTSATEYDYRECLKKAQQSTLQSGDFLNYQDVTYKLNAFEIKE